MDSQKPKNIGAGRRPLDYIAFWQFLCFVILVCLVWTSRNLDLPGILFDAPAEDKPWYAAWILTVGIIVVGFITVGNTYLQERRVLRGFITVCSYCHRVQLDEEAWQQMEIFVSDRTRAEFTHGVCPSCYQRVSQQMDKPSA